MMAIRTKSEALSGRIIVQGAEPDPTDPDGLRLILTSSAELWPAPPGCVAPFPARRGIVPEEFHERQWSRQVVLVSWETESDSEVTNSRVSMPSIELMFHTGNFAVDSLLARLVGILERDYAYRVTAYYPTGSYADDTANAFSDVDFAVIAKDLKDGVEIQQSVNFASPSWPVVERVIFAESELNHSLYADKLVNLKWGSQLLYGRDVRARIAPQLPDYTTAVIRQCRNGIAMLRDSESVLLPICYPDATGEFFGYEKTRSDGHDTVRKVRWYPIGTTEGTKELASVVARCSTGLVAVNAGQFVSTRAKAVEVYSELVADEWTEFIRDVHVNCRLKWGYRIPSLSKDRDHLRSLCERMLSFERHSLEIFEGWSSP